MARDYAKSRHRRHAPPPSRLRWLFLGLAVGIGIATFTSWKDVFLHGLSNRRAAMQASAARHTQKIEHEKDARIRTKHPRFDFYTELPKMKVPAGNNSVAKPVQIKVLPEAPVKPLDQAEKHLLGQVPDVTPTEPVSNVIAPPVAEASPSEHKPVPIEDKSTPEVSPVAKSDYRIMVASYSNLREAETDRASLVMQGLDPHIRQQHGKFMLWLGPYSAESEATPIIRELQKLSYTAKLIS